MKQNSIMFHVAISSVIVEMEFDVSRRFAFRICTGTLIAALYSNYWYRLSGPSQLHYPEKEYTCPVTSSFL